MTKRQTKKLWSYWYEEFGDYQAVWQIVPAPDKVAYTVGGPPWIFIKMLHYSGKSGHEVSPGEVMAFQHCSLKDGRVWTPILKENIPLFVLRNLDK